LEIKQEELFLPENSKAYFVLKQFKERRIQNGIVVDEYGTVEGIVTINYIFDALVGDISEN
jgi:putative hemolysin